MPPPGQVGAGTYFTPKARIYGWAYPPHKTLASFDPDRGEVTSVFQTNLEGWKDVEHSKEKPPGVFRILVLGDSYTFGVVSLADLYTRKLEQILKDRGYKNVEVISMGAPGWGADHALLAFETEGYLYNPDIVIYQNCENDYDALARDLSDEKFFQQEWAQPFMYALKDGKLIKIDLSDKFLKAVEQKSHRPFIQRVGDHFSGFAVSFYLRKSIFLFQDWINEKLYHQNYQQSGEIMMPAFGNEKDATDVKDLSISGKNLSEYKAKYKERSQKTVELARLVSQDKSGKAQKILYVIPSADPFVYRKGPLTEKDIETWKLMEAILVAFKEKAHSIGATFMVFSEDGEEGKREYYQNVGNVKKIGDSYYADWLNQLMEFDWMRGVHELQTIADRDGFPFIPQTRTYPRFIYDNHPNVEGNQNMALDIADFLITSKALPKPN